MKLFDTTERTVSEPKARAAPDYVFLNESARTDVAKLRSVLESWFAKYPESERSGLLGRFQSVENSQHQGAFFELMLHELLLNGGFAPEIHPETEPASDKKPDFLCGFDEGAFYLEATVAVGESDRQRARQAIADQVHDILDQKLDSPNFFLRIEIVSSGPAAPSATRMTRDVSAWLKTLNPDHVTEQYRRGGFESLPDYLWSDGVWKVRFWPISKKAEARGQRGLRPIGIATARSSNWTTPGKQIRKAIDRKAGRYGKLEHPFVIAVNTLVPVEDEEIIEALFGTVAYRVEMTPDGDPGRSRMVRKPDGFWYGPRGPRKTTVSAVLVARHLRASTLAEARLDLYLNPWAKRVVPDTIKDLASSVVFGESEIQLDDGPPLSQLLGLPKTATPFSRRRKP